MKLEGSCHCGAVRFSLDSVTPSPYMKCYCSICRKVAGGGGYAINIGGSTSSLQIEGAEHVSVYETGPSPNGANAPRGRRFCSKCGSALWNYDPRWPDLLHPFASVIDTPLPVPPQTVHIMLGSKANWVSPCVAEGDLEHDEYPEESLASWHARLGIEG
ncbi:MAG: GFA family protein [Alphaproteobacteria bacterium]|nr:GFA family protein [Alphaproteobacteria bacterium]